jgi:Protein of unknown function (DUF3102)
MTVVPLTPRPTLDQLAVKIVARWLEADKFESHAYDARLAVGRMLVDAKAMVKHGEWEAWFKANVPARSLRDAQKCMKMAGAPDPEAARKEERVRNQEDQQRSRANTTDVSRISEIDPTVSLLDQLKTMVRDLNSADDADFKKWVREYYGWTNL